jgi:uncharacterized protein YciI
LRKYVIEYEQRGTSQLREEHRPAHVAYRKELGDHLFLAGPLLDDHDVPVGSLIIVAAADQESAMTLGSRDPYVTVGVLSIVSVRQIRLMHVRGPEPTPT